MYILGKYEAHSAFLMYVEFVVSRVPCLLLKFPVFPPYSMETCLTTSLIPLKLIDVTETNCKRKMMANPFLLY